MNKTSSAQHRASAQAYQLYVELEGVRPKVWRRFLVPVTIELLRLHTTLLFGTGWQGGHIHEFVFGHDIAATSSSTSAPSFPASTVASRLNSGNRPCPNGPTRKPPASGWTRWPPPSWPSRR
ncbi:MAG: hypothetical protein Q7K57_36515 [Burkholderiaceae bacterium]|nr:hypothetical protein [Burkholderiaceae bacterium]